MLTQCSPCRPAPTTSLSSPISQECLQRHPPAIPPNPLGVWQAADPYNHRTWLGDPHTPRGSFPGPPLSGVPAHCGAAGANELSQLQQADKGAALPSNRLGSGDPLNRAEHPPGEWGTHKQDNRVGKRGRGAAALRLTIACSILLSMATTLAPEALEESREAER